MKFQSPANFKNVLIGTAGSHKKADLRFSPYDFVKFAVFDKEVGRVRVELQVLLYSAMDGQQTVI